MPRVLSDAMKTALSQANLNMAIMVDLTFGTVADHVVTPIPVHVWTGIGSVVWSGKTYLGLGSLLDISVADDNATIEARGIEITLSGLNPTDPTQLSTALTEVIVGLPVAMYVALYDSDGFLIDDPFAAWVGRMDQPTWNIAGNEVLLHLACESRLLDMNCSVERRYTQEDQQMAYPGDLGFQFVNSVQETTLFWGTYPTGSANI